MNRGKYIAIEGINGVGKTVLAQMIAKELRAAQLPVRLIDSHEPPTLAIQTIDRIITDPQYPMNSHTEVLLYNAARAESATALQADLENGISCVVDHSYLGSLVDQYYGRGDITDYVTASNIVQFAAGDPGADLVIVLDAPVSTVRTRTSTMQYDDAYLERTRAGYLWEAKQRGFPVVYATDSIDVVFKQAWAHVAALLADRVMPKEKQQVAEKAEPPIVITQAPVEVTTSKTATITTPAPKPVPAPKATPTRPDFTGIYDLTFTPTNLIAMQKPWRTIVHTEMPLVTNAYDQKNAQGHYRYFVPPNIKGKVRSQYIRTMNQLFDNYTAAVSKLTVYLETSSDTPKKEQTTTWHTRMQSQARMILRATLPMASTTTLRITADEQQLEKVLTQITQTHITELREHAQKLVTQANAQQPAFPLRTISTKVDPEPYEKLHQLTNEGLPANYGAATPSVVLVKLTPRNELDVVTDLVYLESDLPLRDIQQQAGRWTYQHKADMLTTYLETPGADQQLLQSIHYSFDVVSDLQTIHALQRHRHIASITMQSLTPRHGYDTPPLVEAAGLGDAYDDCFDASLQLYSAMQSAGRLFEAQYAVLFGHRVRCHIDTTAAELFSIDMSALNNAEYDLIHTMRERVSEIHPLTAETMNTSRTNAAMSKSPINA